MSTHRVTASALNLRSGPGTGYAVREVLPRGAHVEDAAPGWLYVRIGDRVGWVSRQHLEEVEAEPAWLEIARRELGVTEIPGASHNARILEYHAVTTLRATADEVPWCSSFACWVMEAAGIRSTRSAAARSWLQWGRAIDEPMTGCVVVLKRGAPPAGHVGFFVGLDGGRIALLGGNQSNQVRIARFPMADVLGYRMPVEGPPPPAEARAA